MWKFIDFGRTGVGHVFEDFVVLENSFRLQMRSEEIENFSELVEEELRLLRDGVSTLFYGPLVSRLREYALKTFENEGISRYVVASSLVALRHFLNEALEDWQRRQLGAMVLAGIRFIQTEYS